MIHNKKDLYKKLNKVADLKIDQAIQIKTLVVSLKSHKDYDFKKCKEVCNELIEKWMD